VNNPQQRRRLTLPWYLLALDVVGALLVAWGLYRFAGGEGGMLYIAVGFLLMMPFGIHIIYQAVGKRPSSSIDTE
jgi:hypothetical protein